jgi:uncharacterized membrane protein
VFGTLMVLNVWIRILPGQSKMLKEAEAGQVPDNSESWKAKIRSVHNTYFTFPVLFIMLSNHYPIVYNHRLNWLLLITLAVAGALVRHVMVSKSERARWLLLPAAAGLAALVLLTRPEPSANASGPVDDSQVRAIMQTRCLNCHSSNNHDEIYKEAPRGIKFETMDQIRERADKINLHVVVAKSMPLANKTGMTDDERALVGQWLIQQNLVKTP